MTDMNWTRIIVRWLIMAAALVITMLIVPGIHVVGDKGWLTIIVMAAVLGFANAFIRPILNILSCGCIIVTLGLFTFVVNAITFQIAAWIANELFGRAFIVDGFWPALLGSIVFSIACFVINLVIPDGADRR